MEKDINLYMRDNDMKLKFIDQHAGFLLKSTLNNLAEKSNNDLSGMVGDNCEINKKNIVYFDYAFRLPPNYDIEGIINDAKEYNIQGTYTVPELNIKNVSFVDVLEAVKKYYVEKYTKQSKHA